MKKKVNEKRRSSKRVRIESDYNLVNVKKRTKNTKSCPVINVKHIPILHKLHCHDKSIEEASTTTTTTTESYCSFNCDLEKNEFINLSAGVGMCMFNDREEDGIICLSAKCETKFQFNERNMILIIRRGKVSVTIGNVVNSYKTAEVIKIPMNVKYRMKNELTMSKSYIHFQIL